MKTSTDAPRGPIAPNIFLRSCDVDSRLTHARNRVGIEGSSIGGKCEKADSVLGEGDAIVGVDVPGVCDSHFFRCCLFAALELERWELEDSREAITPEIIEMPIVPHPTRLI